jgi:hypothetical protein
VCHVQFVVELRLPQQADAVGDEKLNRLGVGGETRLLCISISLCIQRLESKHF